MQFSVHKILEAATLTTSFNCFWPFSWSGLKVGIHGSSLTKEHGEEILEITRSLEEIITLTLAATSPFTPGVLTLYIGALIPSSPLIYIENPTATLGSYNI